MSTSLNLRIKMSTYPSRNVISTLYGRSSALLQNSSMVTLKYLISLTCSLGWKIYKQHGGENYF